MGLDQVCAGGGIIGVGKAGVAARVALDDDLVSARDKPRDAIGQKADTMLLVFNFAWDADDQEVPGGPGALTFPGSHQLSRSCGRQ